MFKAIATINGQENVPFSELEIEEYNQDVILNELKIEKEKAIVNLQQIDIKSIRAIREYIVSKSDAPQILKDRETAALIEREKLNK